jgi:hypothetical protein
VARRYDLNANLLFKWKRLAEAGQLGGPLATIESAEFVPIGVVGRTGDGGPALLARWTPSRQDVSLYSPAPVMNRRSRPELRRVSGHAGRTSWATDHMKPTSSRATAVHTTVVRLPRAARARYRAVSRACACQAI